MSDDSGPPPIRKIDDATYGTPPQNPHLRRLLRMKRWFLLDANRNAVAGLLLGATFGLIVLVGSWGPVSAQAFLTEGISPGAVLVELMKTIVSVVVIVLSINQLVLSPGLGPVGDQQERYEQSLDLRKRVEDHTGIRVSPTSPAAFLTVLLDAMGDQTARLDETVSLANEEAFREKINQFSTSVSTDASSVRTLLASGRFGQFEVISAALRFAISEKVQMLNELEQIHDESHPESVAASLDEMDELLELYTVSREYLKTVYIRDEYINLSEGLLYIGLPAVVVTYLAAQLYSPTVFPGQFLGIESRLLFVSGAVTMALVPFALLISYVFRLAAMPRSTLFVGPFDARRTGEDLEEAHGHGR